MAHTLCTFKAVAAALDNESLMSPLLANSICLHLRSSCLRMVILNHQEQLNDEDFHNLHFDEFLA